MNRTLPAIVLGLTLACSGTPVQPAMDAGTSDAGDGRCASVTCRTPPPNSCVDSHTERTYAASGDCAAGLCSYAHTDSTCPNGCKSGACVGSDPCMGVTCDQPPAPTCADASTRRVYSATGTCSAGSCSYAHTDSTCPNGCESGACVGSDPCMGVTCDQPPVPTCADASTRRVYSATGTCSAGSCSYAHTDTACSNGCQGGVCVGSDPCAGVTCDQPPAPTCADIYTVSSYSPQGSCDPATGACTYPPTTMQCTGGEQCADGACFMPCSEFCGGCCDSANHCIMPTDQSDSQCGASGSTCAPCDASAGTPNCQEGTCVAPCIGIVCNQPPPNGCADDFTQQLYSPSSGHCDVSTNACTYDAVSQHCPLAEGCQSGTCTTLPGTCAAGETCTVVASSQGALLALAVDSNNLYWTTAAGSVFELPLSSGGAPGLLASSQPNPLSLALSSTTVYWTYTTSLASGMPGGVGDIAIGGGTVGGPINGETSPQQSTPTAIAVDSANAFWTNDYDVSAGCYGSISTVALNAGTSRGTATWLTTNYFNSSTKSYDDLCLPAGIALDATNVYFTDAALGLIGQAPKSGNQATATPLALGQGRPLGIVRAGNQLFWVNSVDSNSSNGDSTGSLMTLTLPSGSASVVVSGQVNLTGSIATDGTNVYWVTAGTMAKNFTDGAVMKVRVAGGAAETIASGQPSPGSVAVDATSVYWTNGDGSIRRATPK